MERCATCRWWGEPAPAWITLPEFDRDRGARYCESPRLVTEEYSRPRAVVADAAAIDGDAYRAWLITAGTFGCVNHEPVPAAVLTTEAG